MVNWLSKLKSGISSTWSNIKTKYTRADTSMAGALPGGTQFDKEKFKKKFKLKPIKKYEFKDFTYKPRVQPIRTQRVTDLVLPSEYTGAPSQTVVISPETTYTSTSVPDRLELEQTLQTKTKKYEQDVQSYMQKQQQLESSPGYVKVEATELAIKKFEGNWDKYKNAGPDGQLGTDDDYYDVPENEQTRFDAELNAVTRLTQVAEPVRDKYSKDLQLLDSDYNLLLEQGKAIDEIKDIQEKSSFAGQSGVGFEEGKGVGWDFGEDIQKKTGAYLQYGTEWLLEPVSFAAGVISGLTPKEEEVPTGRTLMKFGEGEMVAEYKTKKTIGYDPEKIEGGYKKFKGKSEEFAEMIGGATSYVFTRPGDWTPYVSGGIKTTYEGTKYLAKNPETLLLGGAIIGAGAISLGKSELKEAREDPTGYAFETGLEMVTLGALGKGWRAAKGTVKAGTQRKTGKYYLEEIGTGLESHKGEGFKQWMLRYRGEKLTRGGKVWGVQRVSKFDAWKPSTYWDKLKGRKPGTIKSFDDMTEQIWRDVPSQFASPVEELKVGGGIYDVAASGPDIKFMKKSYKSGDTLSTLPSDVLEGIELGGGRTVTGGIEVGRFFGSPTIRPIQTTTKPSFVDRYILRKKPKDITVPTGTPQLYTYYGGLQPTTYLDVMRGQAKFSLLGKQPGVTFGKEYVKPLAKKELKTEIKELSQKLGYDPESMQLSASTLKSLRSELEVIQPLFQEATVTGRVGKIHFPGQYAGKSFDVYTQKVLPLTKQRALRINKKSTDYVKDRINQVEDLLEKNPELGSQGKKLIDRETRNLDRLTKYRETLKNTNYKDFPGYGKTITAPTKELKKKKKSPKSPKLEQISQKELDFLETHKPSAPSYEKGYYTPDYSGGLAPTSSLVSGKISPSKRISQLKSSVSKRSSYSKSLSKSISGRSFSGSMASFSTSFSKPSPSVSKPSPSVSKPSLSLSLSSPSFSASSPSASPSISKPSPSIVKRPFIPRGVKKPLKLKKKYKKKKYEQKYSASLSGLLGGVIGKRPGKLTGVERRGGSKDFSKELKRLTGL